MTLQQDYLRMGKSHPHPTDPDLMRRASDGDDAAYRGLVDRHAPHLYRLAFSLVGNAVDAEDVLQETFLGAFRHLRKFEQRSTVKTWLSRILVRQAAKCHRSRRKHKMVSLNGLSEAAEGLLVGKAATSARTKSDTRMDVMAVLEKLLPIHREVVVLRELHGMSYEEIARILGVPRGTVESRLFRARQELKERLRNYLP